MSAMSRSLVLFSLGLLALAGSPPAAAQKDTFQSGTQGWFSGGGPVGGTPAQPPTHIPTGGPAGAGDGFLRVTAVGGAGPGSRLSVMNASQWARNYLAEGIVGIGMAVNNFGPDALFLRLVFENPIPGPPTDLAISKSVLVPAASGWTQVFFSSRPRDLVALLGTVPNALSTTTILRIYHSPDPTFPGPPVTAQLGIDNITASTVPEPTTMLLLGSGLAGLAGAARRRRAASGN